MRARDQAAKLRELIGQRPSSLQSIAIVSGKGGVGKTNIAVNLSICLAQRGLKVTLVDLDMGLANADLLMNLQPRHTLSHVVAGENDVQSIGVEGPGGIRFIPGSSGLQSMADLSTFERESLLAQLRKLERSTDIMVLDCGAGIGSSVMTFASAADRVVVVTTPQPTALTDGYAMIKALHAEGSGSGVGLFVNMASTRSEAVATYDRIAKVAKRFLNYSVADYGYMVQDIAVGLAVRQRSPFVIRYPNSNASACVAAMAVEFNRTVEGRQRRSGFFSRVAGLFV